jgi:hypothetical protein
MAACILLNTVVFAGAANPANSLEELYQQINSCVKIPQTTEGGDVTIRFSLKRDGSVFGKPRITYAKNLAAMSNQVEFLGSVLQALQNCTPLKITNGLGSAIAGKPLMFRITQKPKQTDL